MKIYLAARYSRRLELCFLRDSLHAAGHQVTSRWLLGGHQWNGTAHSTADAYESGGMPAEAVRFAQEDIEDIDGADVLVAFPDPPRKSSTSRGGMHVELGYALAKRKRVIVCGQRQNVFHLLPEVEYISTKQDLVMMFSNGLPEVL